MSKLYNHILLAITRRLKIPYALGVPRVLMIEPTNLCNLKCPLCPTGLGTLNRPQGNMSFQSFKNLINNNTDALKYAERMYLTLYGEPFMNKDIRKMIRYAKDIGMPHIEISTNANFEITESFAVELVESGLDVMLIAIDGANQKTYEIYRKGGKLDLVKQFITKLVKAKKKLSSAKPLLNVQFIMMKHNNGQLGLVKKMAKELGTDDFKVKTDIFSFVLEQKIINTPIKNVCTQLWTAMTITWDGFVVPCCGDARAEIRLGNVFDRGIREIWNNRMYRNFRKQVVNDKSKIPLCKNCMSK